MPLIRILLTRRHVAMLICVATLAIKLLVPAGYMLSAEHGRLAISLCSGVVPSPTPVAMPASMPMAGMHGDMDHHEQKEPHGQVEMPCAFAGLSHHQALGAIDPILLVAAVAFVMAAGIAPARARKPALFDHLRPPLRGPPLTL